MGLVVGLQCLRVDTTKAFSLVRCENGVGEGDAFLVLSEVPFQIGDVFFKCEGVGGPFAAAP